MVPDLRKFIKYRKPGPVGQSKIPHCGGAEFNGFAGKDDEQMEVSVFSVQEAH